MTNKSNHLEKFFSQRIDDPKALRAALALVDATRHIAAGSYSNACTEKKAAGYMGAVCLAREGIDIAFKEAWDVAAG